jgi:hypothetical protein
MSNVPKSRLAAHLSDFVKRLRGTSLGSPELFGGSLGPSLTTRATPAPSHHGVEAYFAINSGTRLIETVVYDDFLQLRVSDAPGGIRCEYRNAVGDEVLYVEYLLCK